jgi:hypothetical protein
MMTEIRMGTSAVDLLKVLVKSICTKKSCSATAAHQESELIATLADQPLQEPLTELGFRVKHSTSDRKTALRKKSVMSSGNLTQVRRTHLMDPSINKEAILGYSVIFRTELCLDSRKLHEARLRSLTLQRRPPCPPIKASINLNRKTPAGAVMIGEFLEKEAHDQGPCKFPTKWNMAQS